MTDNFYKNERFFIKLERLAPTNIFRVECLIVLAIIVTRKDINHRYAH